jgi:hypothetical protein
MARQFYRSKLPMNDSKIAYETDRGYVEKKLPDCKQAGNFLNNETNFIAKER